MPQGGNTGLVGGQTPDLSGDQIILSTQRLKAIREVDPHADVMICEAGVTLAEAQAAALAADRLFPLSLAAEGTCTIGGNVSTNAGGVTVIAYGNTRDLVDRGRSGPGRRTDRPWPEQAAQGQHRLRREEPLHRRRGHARRRHRGVAEAFPQPSRPRDRLRRPRQSRTRARAASRWRASASAAA